MPFPAREKAFFIYYYRNPDCPATAPASCHADSKNSSRCLNESGLPVRLCFACINKSVWRYHPDVCTKTIIGKCLCL
jgi:hypothetical protein